MPDKIKIMISSTIKDLIADRDAVKKCFNSQYPFVELVGANPVDNGNSPGSPFIKTLKMATDCDFFILILGSRYGYEIREDTSATEAEFDAAYRNDPTKILIFKKEGETPEHKQEQFINKVGDYYKGFWITSYQFTHDLQEIVNVGFLSLLKERAAIGTNLNYFDHFIRIARQRVPSPEIQSDYSLRNETIEFTYHFPKKDRVIHFEKEHIYKNFWGCIAKLEHLFHEWRNE